MSDLHSREREAKFKVAPDTHPTLFAQPVAFDGYTRQEIGVVDQTDTYFDTAAYELLRQGIALRLRHNGARHEVGIKSIHATRKGAIQERMDVAIALPAEASPFDATTWPAAVDEQLVAYAVKAKKLYPVLVVRQSRQKAKLLPAATDSPLAEWSLDTVWLEQVRNISPHAASKQDNEQLELKFHELELELLPNGAGAGDGNDARVDAFDALVRETQARFDLVPLFASKFVRGVEAEIARAHGNAQRIAPTMTLAAACRLLLHQQVFQILLHEHLARQQESVRKSARAIHTMRVAIRRSRAILHLYQSVLPTVQAHLAQGETAQEETAQVQSIIKGLRRLGRKLGYVRDLDVALANLRAFRRGQPESLQKGLKLLRGELRSRRKEAHADLLLLLDSKKHRKFIVRCLDFCRTPETAQHTVVPSGDQVSPSQVRHTLPSRILAAFEAVRAYETVITPTNQPPLATFHALRIETKYLRYLLEFTEDLLGNAGEALIDQLRLLQEHLGALNDAHVEQARLQQWRTASTVDAALCEAIDARLDDIATTLATLTAATNTKLNALVNSASRATLATALAWL